MTTSKAQVLPLFEFDVNDGDGFWGGMRVRAATQAEAEEQVRQDLAAHELEPEGSLLPDFTLTLIHPT